MVMIIIVFFSFTNKLYHIFLFFSNKMIWSGWSDSNRHDTRSTDFKSAAAAVTPHPDAPVSIPQRQHIQLSSVKRIQSFLKGTKVSFNLLQILYFTLICKRMGLEPIRAIQHAAALPLKLPLDIRADLVGNEVGSWTPSYMVAILYNGGKKFEKLQFIFCKYIIS